MFYMTISPQLERLIKGEILLTGKWPTEVYLTDELYYEISTEFYQRRALAGDSMLPPICKGFPNTVLCPGGVVLLLRKEDTH
jgi:hypothetical protein